MNKTEVYFTPCDPAPSKGYILKWRVRGTTGIYNFAGNFFSSPAIFYDNVNPDGTQYEGYIQAEIDGPECDKVYWPGASSGCAGGDAKFVTTTYIGGDSLNLYETANLFGTNGVSVHVVLDTLTNINGGKVLVNGSEAYEGNTWDFVIDSYCAAKFDVSIKGVDNPGTAILAHFTITSVSAGLIGSPNTYQISKAF